MDEVIFVLQLAEAATESLSVPALTNVVKLSLKLAERGKEIKDTKDDMRSLAEHAAKTTTAIYEALSLAADHLDVDEVNTHLNELLSTLQKVEAIMLRPAKKSTFKFVLHSSKYKSQLEELNKDLDRAVEKFHIQGSIRTNLQLSNIRRTQAELAKYADDSQRVDTELLRHARDVENRLAQLSIETKNDNATHDGTMRLFGREDLELLEELDPESPVGESGESAVRYKARLRFGDRGLVTVRRFPRPDNNFHHEVEVGRDIWHPNVAHPIGYSRLDPKTAFIVVDGFHTRTFNERSRTFHGPDKMKWMMKAAKDTCAGLVYLSSVYDKLGWSPDDNMYPLSAERELLVSSDGRILLDPSCFRLDRLPNTIIHDDGMIELHSRGRELVKAFKFDREVAPAERYQYLQTLWRNFVQMADFSRDESIYWRSLRIPGPGEVFSLSSEEIIPEIVYDDLVHTEKLVPEYSTPHFEGSMDTTSSPPPLVEQGLVVHSMPVDGCYTTKTPWRRYIVHGLSYDWTLETTTGVRESADCRGWFMNEAPHLCDLPGDMLEDLAIAYALKFRTRTSLVKVSEDAASCKPPRRLYFYERVHDYPHASLDPKINWPWGFWSTDPNDECDITEFHDAHLSLPARHSIAFLGVSQDREFTWVQQLGSWMFYIQVRVEVEYYTLTVEECLVLQEMRQCSSDSDDTSHRFEEITDRDVVMGSASDSEDDDTAMADDWSESSDDADEFDDWLSDESRTAEDLKWLSGPLGRPREVRVWSMDAKNQRLHSLWLTWHFWQMNIANVSAWACPKDFIHLRMLLR